MPKKDKNNHEIQQPLLGQDSLAERFNDGKSISEDYDMVSKGSGTELGGSWVSFGGENSFSQSSEQQDSQQKDEDEKSLVSELSTGEFSDDNTDIDLLDDVVSVKSEKKAISTKANFILGQISIIDKRVSELDGGAMPLENEKKSELTKLKDLYIKKNNNVDLSQEEDTLGHYLQQKYALLLGLPEARKVSRVTPPQPVPSMAVETDEEDQENEQAAPLAVDPTKLLPITEYDKDEAKKESEELAEIILEKIKKGDRTLTPITDLSKHSHLIESLKSKNENIKVNVSFQGEFRDLIKYIKNNNTELAKDPAKTDIILKQLISDVSLANKLTFESDESEKLFVAEAARLGVSLLESLEIEVKGNSLSQGQPQPQGEQNLEEEQTTEEEQTRQTVPDEVEFTEHNSTSDDDLSQLSNLSVPIDDAKSKKSKLSAKAATNGKKEKTQTKTQSNKNVGGRSVGW